MRGIAYLRNFPLQRNSCAFALLQHVDEARFLLLQVFFGIDATVHCEAALLRHDIEIGAATALSTEHQDRMARLFAANVTDSPSLLDLSLQLLQSLDNAN